MTFDIVIEGSKGTMGGINAAVRCCLHEWDLSDQIYPEYMAMQTEREDFEDDSTVVVLQIRIDHRDLENKIRVMAALTKFWDYLGTNVGMFQCAKDDDPTAITVPNYEGVKQTVVGKAFCERLAILRDALPQEDQWKGCPIETDIVVSAIEAFVV